MTSKMNIAVIGHQQSGKSTLVARLIIEAGIHDARITYDLPSIQRHLKSEKENVTSIDNTLAAITTSKYKCTLLDTPGLGDIQSIRETIRLIYLADVAILVIDSSDSSLESHSKTRENVWLSFAFGVKDIICCVNKMDQTKYSQVRYDSIVNVVSSVLREVGYKEGQFRFVPVSGLAEKNIKTWDTDLMWHRDGSLLSALDMIDAAITRPFLQRPLRLALYEYLKIYKMGTLPSKRKQKYKEWTVLIGRIQAGVLKHDMEIKIGPAVAVLSDSNKYGGGTARVKDIEMNDLSLEALAGDNVRVYVCDLPLPSLRRGNVISDSTNPAKETWKFTAKIYVDFPENKEICEGYMATIHCHLTQAKVKFHRLISTWEDDGTENTEPRVLKNGIAFHVEIIALGLTCFLSLEPDEKFILMDEKEEKFIAHGYVLTVEEKKKEERAEEIDYGTYRDNERISLRNSQMKNRWDLVDRITDLPDSILGLILSHLPTKEAVVTSILSKRWQFGWVTIHNLDFCNNNDDEGDNMEFVRFVNRVLLYHDAEFLYKFCLEWKTDCVPSKVNSWISTVIDKHVSELFLCLGSPKLGMPVAVSCFDCASLQSLKLDGFIFVSAATVFSLPKLKSLQLVQVDFESEDTFVKLINGCSVLDDLCIHTEDGEFTYRIFSTSLRRLTYTCDCDLNLKASSLEYLELKGFMSGISVPESLSSLVEADIRIEHRFSKANECNSIVKVVRASNSAKFLTLLDNVMKALRCATISLSTEFRSLVKLEVEIECCPWSSLRDFIQNADNLENLTIWQGGEDNHYHHSKWTTPVEVPRCLSNSLKKVFIEGYKGMEDEHGMILYMLEHRSVLEVMMLTCYGGERLFELLQEIRESPKKSLRFVKLRSSSVTDQRLLVYFEVFSSPLAWTLNPLIE